VAGSDRQRLMLKVRLTVGACRIPRLRPISGSAVSRSPGLFGRRSMRGTVAIVGDSGSGKMSASTRTKVERFAPGARSARTCRGALLPAPPTRSLSADEFLTITPRA
jgi:hypothetical protein